MTNHELNKLNGEANIMRFTRAQIEMVGPFTEDGRVQNGRENF